MADGKCAHESCKCLVTGRAVSSGGKEYCSQHCAEMGASTRSESCGCGHPECR
jgi:hypothetical protein